MGKTRPQKGYIGRLSKAVAGIPAIPPPDIYTSADVRRLECCTICRVPGVRNAGIIDAPNVTAHPRCFVEKFGIVEFLQLGEALEHVRLNDIGVELMRLVLEVSRG